MSNEAMMHAMSLSTRDYALLLCKDAISLREVGRHDLADIFESMASILDDMADEMARQGRGETNDG